MSHDAKVLHILGSYSWVLDRTEREDCDVQVGKYKPAQRAATVLYRGAQFFAVSFAASMVGHSLTKYLVSPFTTRHCLLATQQCLMIALQSLLTTSRCLLTISDVFWLPFQSLCNTYSILTP